MNICINYLFIKGLYRIKDEFFQFWFGYVFPMRGDIEMDRHDKLLHAIKQGIQYHLAMTYEKVALSILLEDDKLFPPFDRLGRWWDRNEEIDIIGFNKESNTILFAEIKWSEKPIGVNILNDLKTKAEKVQWGNSRTTKHFALFLMKGFTSEMLKAAEREKVLLFKGIEKVG